MGKKIRRVKNLQKILRMSTALQTVLSMFFGIKRVMLLLRK